MFRRAQKLTQRFSDQYHRSVDWGRKQSRLFDHLWRTKERYAAVLGGRLAAAIAYYGFFATFALAAVVYGVLLKSFSGNLQLVEDVDAFLKQYFTTLSVDVLKDRSGAITTVGTISLIFAGIGWVDAWRSSLRAIWGLDQHPGNFLALRIVDLLTLLVFGLMLGISLGATDLLKQLVEWITGGPNEWLSYAQFGLTFTINMVIGLGLMTILPRLHLSPRRLIPSVTAVAVGLTLLNWLGRFLVLRTENNPAYTIVATSVGLLIYLYFFNQIVLWSAAYAATSSRGRALDLAWGKPRDTDPISDPAAQPEPGDRA